MIFHLVPIRRSAHDLFHDAVSFLTAMPIAAPSMPTRELLTGLFDLTAAEARIARLIAGGSTVNDIARTLSLSRETVRSHLKKVMVKTGTSRQAEFVQLLAGTARPEVS